MKNRYLYTLIIVLIFCIVIGVYAYKQKHASLKNTIDLTQSPQKLNTKFDPKAKSYCEEAILYMEKGNFKKAIENLKVSIEIDPAYPKAQYAMAVCYARIDPPNTALARQHYEKAKELGYQVPEWFERHLKKLEGE